MPVVDTIITSATVWRRLWMLLLCASLGACASVDSKQNTVPGSDTESGSINNSDPYETFNRKVYAFNFKFDKAIGKPVATVYVKYLPAPVRRSVANFFNNLWEPNSIINALLQGKLEKAAMSTSRFILNSTVGIFGLFDVSTVIDIPRQEEDLGQTLAVWGVKDGPYLVLPFLGPSTILDASTLGVEWFYMDLVPILFSGTERWIVGGTRLIDARASVLGLEEVLEFQVDPYVFLRESYHQSRLIQINDGVLQPEAEEDPFEDALFAE
jgi:phospholipid-binding lipoprotein MlaA